MVAFLARVGHVPERAVHKLSLHVVALLGDLGSSKFHIRSELCSISSMSQTNPRELEGGRNLGML